MMRYNTQLQENNTSLNSVLSKVNNLPDKPGEKGLVIEKWDFTLEDGSVISKYVEHPKVYNITLNLLFGGVTSSNSQKTILHGQDYTTTFTASSSADAYIFYVAVDYIYKDYTVKEVVFEDWDAESNHSYDLLVKNVPCDIEITVDWLEP